MAFLLPEFQQYIGRYSGFPHFSLHQKDFEDKYGALVEKY
jgi:hypothetical protein